MKARVIVTLKTGVLDPQGKAIEGALRSLGIEGVDSVRQGKVFEVELAGTDRASAEAEGGAGLDDDVLDPPRAAVEDQIRDGLERDTFYRDGIHVDGTKMTPVDVDDTWPRWIVEGHAPASWYRPR
jgi:phosphoribosylformylglycinamidine synthase